MNCCQGPLGHSSECVQAVKDCLPVTGYFLCSEAFGFPALDQSLTLLELNLKLWICSVTRHGNAHLASVCSG